MKRICKKLASSRGFTLAESLVCVLILLMVTGIVAAAIPTASNVYTGVVDAANAQILESTAVTVLRDELSTAREILVDEVDQQTQKAIIMYRSAETGRWNMIVSTHMTTDEGEKINNIKIFEYGKSDVSASYADFDAAYAGVNYDDVAGRYLVSEKATTQNLSISFDTVTVSDGLITINNLEVYRNGSDTPIAKRAKLVIKTVA